METTSSAVFSEPWHSWAISSLTQTSSLSISPHWATDGQKDCVSVRRMWSVKRKYARVTFRAQGASWKIFKFVLQITRKTSDPHKERTRERSHCRDVSRQPMSQRKRCEGGKTKNPNSYIVFPHTAGDGQASVKRECFTEWMCSLWLKLIWR